MAERNVVVRPGKHVGWWVEGRKASGALFMLVWWPTQGVARTIAKWVGG